MVQQFLSAERKDQHRILGFPGGSVVKNPPANAGVTGSIPDPGRSHMPRSSEACAPQLLSLCSSKKPQDTY